MDGVSTDRYLTAFVWDEAKHPARRPLRETVEKLQEGVAKVDDDFKVKTSEYTNVGRLRLKPMSASSQQDVVGVYVLFPMCDLTTC